MDEPAFQHRSSQGSVFAGELDLLFEEAEGGEANTVVALAHDLSGRILPAMSVSAVVAGGGCCGIAAAPLSPDSWPACLNQSQLCLSGRNP